MSAPTKRGASRRQARPSVAKYTPRTPEEPKLLHVMERREGPDGELVEVTRADKIIAYLRSNASFAAAAAAVNVDSRTLTAWRREGAEAQVKAEAIRAGTGNGLRLTKRERVLIDFVQRVEQAIGENHVRLAGAATKLAEGGIPTRTITEKVERHHTADGEVIERVVERKTTESATLPSLPALELVLGRRFKDDWGRTDTLNVNTHHDVAVTVDQLGPVLDQLSTKIAARAARAALAAGTDDDVVDAEVIEPDGYLQGQVEQMAASLDSDPDPELQARVRALTEAPAAPA